MEALAQSVWFISANTALYCIPTAYSCIPRAPPCLPHTCCDLLVLNSLPCSLLPLHLCICISLYICCSLCLKHPSLLCPPGCLLLSLRGISSGSFLQPLWKNCLSSISLCSTIPCVPLSRHLCSLPALSSLRSGALSFTQDLRGPDT